MPRTSDFRYYPVEAISVTVSDHSVRMEFGLEVAPGSAEPAQFSGGLYMTLKTAKTVATYLGRVIEEVENATGRKIAFDESGLAKLGDDFAARFPRAATQEDQA